MKKTYIVPSIKTRKIEAVMPLCTSGDITGEPAKDLGTGFKTESVTGDKALGKKLGSSWIDDEEDW